MRLDRHRSLGEITKIQMGQSPPGSTYNDRGEGLPFFQGKAQFGERFPIADKWCSEPIRIAEKDDVLLSVRAPVGPTNRAAERCCIGRGLAALRTATPALEQDYLHWFMRIVEPTLAAKGSGSTFQAVGRKEIASLAMPLPPLDEQRRIVGLLDRAAEITRRAEAARAKARAIIPALFLDTFGDPATNPKGWPVITVGALLESASYGTSQKANDRGVGIPMLRMGNVTYDGSLDTTDLKHIEIEGDEGEKAAVHHGDILFNRTNSKELVGKTGLWDGRFEAVAASYFIRLRVDRRICHPAYLWAFMNTGFMKRILFAIARGAIGQANINAKELKAFRVVRPPLDVQASFAEQIQHIESLSCHLDSAAAKAEAMAAALSAEVFQAGPRRGNGYAGPEAQQLPQAPSSAQ
jgi:type I restriction enzyme S subunit